jgi:hypothetical protein
VKGLFSFLLALSLLTPVSIQAQEQTQFGDFFALEMDKEVVDHVLSEGNDIYVKITKGYWDASFTVRISNAKRTDYRTWLDGASDRRVNVYRSQQTDKQGYTYRINTRAEFVEYWVGDRLVLHLERRQ